MSFVWQTVEQAAVTLGISTRTIARRIAKGELESRLNSGRREVYIPVSQAAKSPANDTIDADFTQADVQPDPSYEETIRHTVSAASSFGADVETSTALILAEDRARRAEMAITVIQQSTAIVRDEAYRARAGARWAWGTVALMAACVLVAVGWTTTNLTKTQQQAQTLRDKVTIATETSDRLQRDFTTDRTRLEAQLASARQEAAKAQGQLQEVRSDAESAKAQLAAAREKPATTRPSNVAQRIAQAVLGTD